MVRLEYLKQRLKLYLEAESKILQAQNYTLDNRTLTRTDLSKVQAEITNLMEEISLLTDKNGRTRRALLID